jgi:hypothetical protein
MVSGITTLSTRLGAIAIHHRRVLKKLTAMAQLPLYLQKQHHSRAGVNRFLSLALLELYTHDRHIRSLNGFTGFLNRP